MLNALASNINTHINAMQFLVHEHEPETNFSGKKHKEKLSTRWESNPDAGHHALSATWEIATAIAAADLSQSFCANPHANCALPWNPTKLCGESLFTRTTSSTEIKSPNLFLDASDCTSPLFLPSSVTSFTFIKRQRQKLSLPCLCLCMFLSCQHVKRCQRCMLLCH